MKFLLVGFDGLRPEMVTEELMPNLFRFAQRGVNFESHRCCFPSATYVNLPSLVTGTTPAQHGIVANYYLDRSVDPRERFEGSNVTRIEKAHQAYNGKLYGTVSAGEILGLAGRRLAVISTNTPGSVRLKHHQVFDHSHLCLSCHTPATSYPADEVAQIVARLGAPPQKVFPNLEGITYATNVFLEHICRRELPDLTILWYDEPDDSYHAYGIGAPESLQALRHADSEFARVIEWWRSSDQQESLQILVVSDHGQITQKIKVSMAELLRDAGFKVDDHLEDGADLALIAGYCGGILVRDKDPGLTRAIGDALMAFDCCGMVFSAGRDEVEGSIPGSFSKSLVMADHPRSPDIYYVLRTDNESDGHGYIGNCYFDSGLPVGGGIHGGLHPKEMHSTLIAGGSFFRESASVEACSGITDILPTVLHGLGLSLADSTDGRVLYEAMAGSDGAIPDTISEEFETGASSYRQLLQRKRVDNTVYLDGGWRSR
jgi:arylsulfatase A-like enzyme